MLVAVQADRKTHDVPLKPTDRKSSDCIKLFVYVLKWANSENSIIEHR
jgi:hypothetical protein